MSKQLSIKKEQRVVLKDKRAIRNHLDCIHAIALANLGELASGLALLSIIEPSLKAIVVNKN